MLTAGIALCKLRSCVVMCDVLDYLGGGREGGVLLQENAFKIRSNVQVQPLHAVLLCTWRTSTPGRCTSVRVHTCFPARREQRAMRFIPRHP